MLRWRCHIKTHYLQQLIHVNKNNKQMGETPKQIKNKRPLLEDVRFSKVASLSFLSSSLPLFINSVSKHHTCWFVSFSIVCFLLLEDLYVTVFPEPRIPNLISLLKTLRTPLTRQARWVSSLHVGKARGFDGAGDEKEGAMLFSESLSPQMPQRRVSARSFLFPWHSTHKHNS